jgi:predicted alpha/beta hydrolase family esterase
VSRIIILHGKPDKEEYLNPERPSSSNCHWLPWLQNQLLIAGHDAQTPEVYRSFEPDYSSWRREVERHLTEDPLILVGHSCGGGFFIRWLSEHTGASVEKLVLVAPWLDPDRTLGTDFFDFRIDPKLATRVGEFHIFHSSDDPYADVHTSVNNLLDTFPTAIQHSYEQMGHFCWEDMGTDAFPDLLNTIVGPSSLVP